MSQELYKRYRPKDYDEVIGNEAAIATLEALLLGVDQEPSPEKRIKPGAAGKRKAKKEKGVFPHAVLFVGPTGCGKTTLARITAKRLGCSKMDLAEVNSADFKGIDTVRGIREHVGLSPMQGKCRVWIVDECHELTGAAQDAFLKLLEDTPSHVYFFLATTRPEKLVAALRNRMTKVAVKSLSNEEMLVLLETVLEQEDVDIEEEVQDAIIRDAEGSPRQALITLNQVIGLEDIESQLGAIVSQRESAEAYQLWRALMYENWSSCRSVLENLKEDPEGIRRYILACTAGEALKPKGKAQKADLIFQAFQYNYFDTGRAGLVNSCYNVLAPR